MVGTEWSGESSLCVDATRVCSALCCAAAAQRDLSSARAESRASQAALADSTTQLQQARETLEQQRVLVQALQQDGASSAAC